MLGPARDYSIAYKRARRAARLGQRLAYSDAELIVSLSNSLSEREHEIARRNGFTGRLLALFGGEDAARSIAIDGVRLQLLHELVGQVPYKEIDLDGVYNVELAFFRKLLDSARKAAATAPEAKP